MKVLIVGASGATGRLLVKELLNREMNVVAIVRSPEKIHEFLGTHPQLSVVQASLLELSDEALISLVEGCDAVASCLGHNLTLKGIYGKPRRLVTDATRRLCAAIEANTSMPPGKYVLMNTSGNRNRDLKEQISFLQRLVLGLIRLLLPPQPDNEKAADYLRTGIGQNHKTIEWVAVRPDSLVNEAHVSDYDLHPSPIRSALFNPGKTSRINVAHFIADLITDKAKWDAWKGQMPVIYNRSAPKP
ncbi:MAG: NAD(P)-binding oxidoreductase [Bacteroidota bacterium]